MIKTIIGIDPGVQNGVALWSKEEGYLSFHTVNFFDLLDLIDGLIRDDAKDVMFIVEDPRKNKPTFNRFKGKAVNEKISQDVGSNKRTTQLIEDYLRIAEVSFRLVRPMSSKWDHTIFAKITGVKRKCSQHARDAAKLIHGFKM